MNTYYGRFTYGGIITYPNKRKGIITSMKSSDGDKIFTVTPLSKWKVIRIVQIAFIRLKIKFQPINK